MPLADALVQFLIDLGLTHVFGVSGANIEHLFYAAAHTEKLTPILAKHEANAVTMAEGYFRKTGSLAAVMVTSGGGAFHTLAPLTEALASGIPMLVLVGQIPQASEGRGGFQDSSGHTTHRTPIDAEAIFAPVSVAVRKVREPAALGEALQDLVAEAWGKCGPAVLLIPRDLFEKTVEVLPKPKLNRARAAVADPRAIVRAAEIVAAARQPVMILGKELAHAGAMASLRVIAARTGALLALTPDAKGLWDHWADECVGIVGVMGHPAAEAALLEADLIMAVGTALPMMSKPSAQVFEGKTFLSCHRLPSFVTPADAPGLKMSEVIGDLAMTLQELARSLAARPPRSSWSRPRSLTCREALDQPAPDSGMVAMQTAMDILAEAHARADVFVDAGNAGAAAIHYFMHRGASLFSVALGMGGMGHSFGCAIGASFAQCEPRQRSLLIAGDGAFYMYGLEIHTAWQYRLPITFVLINNNGHAMCHIREDLYLGPPSGDQLFRPSALARGMGAMLPGLRSYEVTKADELRAALHELASCADPAVIAIRTSPSEVPPFLPFLKGRAQPRS